MMKNKIPSEGLRLGRDSGSILCDTLKKVAFSDSLGGVTTDIALRIFSTISGRLICLSGIIVTGSLVRKSEPMYLSL